MRCLFPLTLLVALPAHAVIVRGKVTSPLGVPLPGVQVQLIQGQRSVAGTVAGPDGTYEVQSALAGRFLLLTSPSGLQPGFAPQVGESFYAGTSDVLNIDIALDPTAITPQLASAATLVPTVTAQLAAHVSQLPADELLTSTTLLPELRNLPSARVVQYGALGAPVLLLERGAPPQSLLADFDGVTANPLGQAFNLATLGSSGLSMFSAHAAVELTPGANPLQPVGASGATLGLHPSLADNLHPTLTYTGSAGSRGALQNEALASLARSRFDVLGGFSRFDLGNATPAKPYHLVTWSANAGYHISGDTSLRVTFRDDLSATGLASPYELFGVVPSGRDAHQNILGSATFDTRTRRGWHSQLRFGLARLRQQIFDYATPETGLPVTLTGSNGVTATGTAAFVPLPTREDTVTNRDLGSYETDFAWKPWLRLVGRGEYQAERAADTLPQQKQTLDRTHLAFAAGLQGDIKHRVFYEVAGSFDHNPIYGNAGNPRLGLTYAPVRQGTRKFRGTTLHATAATGTRETSLLEQTTTPGSFVQPRSRTFDVSLDQTVLPQKLTLRATWFHSQFSHEFEPLGISSTTAHALLSQTLALRTQGLELNLRFQPYQRVLLEGGYTYLAALTEQSGAISSPNPALPGAAIGALTALAGQRPFERPPSSGFLVAEYSGEKLNLSLKAAFASCADSTTGLLQTPALLLPNRNLSPGYASLDANLSYVLTHRLTFVSQFTNLTDDRHIAPFGSLSTPFVARAGLRIRLGRE